MSKSIEHEILTKTLTEEQMRLELDYFVTYWTKSGFDSCEVLFGYEWGIHYYSDPIWTKETLRIENLVSKISELEQSDLGKFGNNDVIVYITELETLFCHDSDVHIRFTNPSIHIEHFYERWTNLGYNPSEWQKDDPKGPGTKLR